MKIYKKSNILKNKIVFAILGFLGIGSIINQG